MVQRVMFMFLFFLQKESTYLNWASDQFDLFHTERICRAKVSIFWKINISYFSCCLLLPCYRDIHYLYSLLSWKFLNWYTHTPYILYTSIYSCVCTHTHIHTHTHTRTHIHTHIFQANFGHNILVSKFSPKWIFLSG